jgi:hypothetical protein
VTTRRPERRDDARLGSRQIARQPRLEARRCEIEKCADFQRQQSAAEIDDGSKVSSSSDSLPSFTGWAT